MQFSCHLITGRNVKDLSLENDLPNILLYILYIFSTKVYTKTKGVEVKLPPN